MHLIPNRLPKRHPWNPLRCTQHSPQDYGSGCTLGLAFRYRSAATLTQRSFSKRFEQPNGLGTVYDRGLTYRGIKPT